MGKIPQTADQLSAQLDKQLRWLKRSIASFDEGFEDEAGRLAVVVRVLVHDTRSSHSLLGQLDQKNVPFFDGSLPPAAGNLSSYGGLVQIVVGGSKNGRLLPVLDHAPIQRVLCPSTIGGPLLSLLGPLGHLYRAKKLFLPLPIKTGERTSIRR